MDTLVNKVAESGIITIDLTHYMPLESAMAGFDLKPFLFREMILREKDYREALKQLDWSQYAGKHVYIHCSVDAIIPMWAYMLAAANLQPVAASVYFGTKESMEHHLTLAAIAKIDVEEFAEKRLVIKGCGDISAPAEAYVAITALLLPVAKSLMYGEPCSTVPVYKKKN